MSVPLCIDLFCGLGGWTEGFLATGYNVIGFDIERRPYPAQLVLQDVLTLHGSQFKDAYVIVASPPCQSYSWLAMPWSRSKTNNSQKAKALRRKWETDGADNRLFDACFRIQKEASESARRYIPLVVENVRGAEPWVGPAKWKYGSFYLWGDVPALMPFTNGSRMKYPADCGPRLWKDRDVPRLNDGESHIKGRIGGGSWFYQSRNDPRDVRRTSNDDGLKRPGRQIKDGFNNWPKDEHGAYIMPDGTKIGGDWFSDPNSTCRKHGSRSAARKQASAQIAKIPRPLAEHIARCFKP